MEYSDGKVEEGALHKGSSPPVKTQRTKRAIKWS